MKWIVSFTSAIAVDAQGQWITRAWCWFRQADRKFICIPEHVA